MALFSSAVTDKINKIAAKSNEQLEQPVAINTKSINDDLNRMSNDVIKYFKDSPAILIESKQSLHDYVNKCIETGYGGIDTETTGLDRIHDHIVGASLYTPGLPECYIPMKHIVPLFDTPYKNQLSYESVSEEFQRLADNHVKLIFANADFDLAMIYKDIKVDLCDAFYYDVITAWRCLREDEKDNSLKGLYAKYPMKGKVDPKKFSDFFSAKLFPYCKPQVAALYAANDAKITYELFLWQLPYVTVSHEKCKKNHLEKIANLVWNIEFPMVKVCAMLHRRGMYLDDSISGKLHERYTEALHKDEAEMARLIQELIDTKDIATNRNRPFRTGSDFNPNSNPHVKYLVEKLLGKSAKSTGKDVLNEINEPATNQVLKVRGDVKLLGTYVDKMPRILGPDHRVHSTFKSIGAACITGESIIATNRGYATMNEVCEEVISNDGLFAEVDNLSIINMNQISEAASHVIKYTDVPTLKIELECGFCIEGTPNHPIMVSQFTESDNIVGNHKLLTKFWENRLFKQLSELNVGDWVEMPCNYLCCPSEYVPTDFTLHSPYQTSKTIARMPQYYDEDFAEFLGMYHADGSSCLREGTYTIALSNQYPEVVHRFEELGLSLFNVPASHYTAQSHLHEVETYLNCIQIKDIDKILYHGKRNKKIPKAIWRSPKTVINSYIKGMTLDSSVYRDGSGKAAFELSVFDYTDANLIMIHLCSQGILCHLGYNVNKDGLISFRLGFNADNYIIFRNTIGFIENRHYIDTEPCKKNKYAYRRIGNSFRLKVKSITPSTNTVYDLHVPKTHSFVANGIISHNTGRMSSESPNAQNIPSHALDIRHMFRATPERTELINIQQLDSSPSVTLILEDKLNTPSGKVKVRDLKEGDIVLMKDGALDIETKIISIVVNKGQATIQFGGS